MKYRALIPVFLALATNHLHSILVAGNAVAVPDATAEVDEEGTVGATSSRTYHAFRQLITQKDPKCSANSKCKDRGLTGNWYGGT
jgi:hypothetical protein